MGFLKRDVKLKGHRGVLITTAALNNFLSHLKLHYILCYAYISQSLEKGPFPVKSHELPVFIDICFFFLVSIQLEEEMWEQAVPAADKDVRNFPPSTYGTGP